MEPLDRTDPGPLHGPTDRSGPQGQVVYGPQPRHVPASPQVQRMGLQGFQSPQGRLCYTGALQVLSATAPGKSYSSLQAIFHRLQHVWHGGTAAPLQHHPVLPGLVPRLHTAPPWAATAYYHRAHVCAEDLTWSPGVRFLCFTGGLRRTSTHLPPSVQHSPMQERRLPVGHLPVPAGPLQEAAQGAYFGWPPTLQWVNMWDCARDFHPGLEHHSAFSSHVGLPRLFLLIPP